MLKIKDLVKVTAGKRGYFRINLTTKKELWLEAWVVEKDGSAGYLSYASRLK